MSEISCKQSTIGPRRVATVKSSDPQRLQVFSCSSHAQSPALIEVHINDQHQGRFSVVVSVEFAEEMAWALRSAASAAREPSEEEVIAEMREAYRRAAARPDRIPF